MENNEGLLEEQLGDLVEDLKQITLPFDLYTGLSLVVEELAVKEFKYTHFTTENGYSTLIFKSEIKQEFINVTIEKEDLLIRQFTMNGQSGKLKVIYVLKPSERTFKLI